MHKVGPIAALVVILSFVTVWVVMKSRAEDPKPEPNPATEQLGDLTNTRWAWGSGGELVLLPNGIATHTKWKLTGSWYQESDGSLRLFNDNRKRRFIVTSKDGVGSVQGLYDGTGTMIVRKPAPPLLTDRLSRSLA